MRNETLVASSDRGVSSLSARIRLIGFQTPDHHNRPGYILQSLQRSEGATPGRLRGEYEFTQPR